MLPVPWIAPDDHDSPFPDVEQAMEEPNGLVAIGGPLSRRRLERAYRAGIFPWFAEDQPVLWWSPDTRAIIRPGHMHLSRSLRKRLRRNEFAVTADTAFRQVVTACAGPRAAATGTWITPDMIAAYNGLHEAGLGHSVEVWRDGRLVGGLYGVSLGRAFFGESMFSHETDASKVALAWLCAQLRRWAFAFIDCQLPTEHLTRLGAECITRRRFMQRLREALDAPDLTAAWTLDADVDPLTAGDGR